MVFEKHGARPIDFRQCSKRLGKKDGLFVLKRPACPDWLNRTFYEQYGAQGNLSTSPRLQSATRINGSNGTDDGTNTPRTQLQSGSTNLT